MFHLIAMAASAGGLQALSAVLAELPRRFPVPIVVVQHIPAQPNMLPAVLSRRTVLPVREAAEGDVLVVGGVYVAPPGFHMEIALCGASITVRLAGSAPFHFVRPSADRLFETAAEACGPVVGVVLTGNGTDGAAGALAIKRAGGVVIAQDETSAQFAGMPHAAILTGAVDLVLPLAEIAPALMRLTARRDDHEGH